jgi:hypothetical protein
MALSITHSTVVVVPDDGTSPVGTNEWNAAHTVTGTVGPTVGARELLTAARTYYVATTGSDLADGLTALTPCLTTQHVYDDIICATLDTAGFTVTIQMADGSYGNGGALNIANTWVGGGTIVWQGNLSDNADVEVVSTTYCLYIGANLPALFTVKSMHFEATLSGIVGAATGKVAVDDMSYGACGFEHINAGAGSYLLCGGIEDISGGGTSHLRAIGLGQIGHYCFDSTLTGTPAFSIAFADAGPLGFIDAASSFVGSATGPRYSSTGNAVINTYGSGANYFPGNSAGSTGTGGQYT